MVNIDEVDIEYLRGITSCNLSLQGKWLYLLGENGTGKSSFVDALEYFFTGGVQHLQGAQGLSIRDHLHHVDELAESVSVAVRFGGDASYDVVRKGSQNLSAVPANLKGYFDGAASGTFMLRRETLLRFICAVPSGRFEALDALIGIENLEDVELSMKHAQNELQARVVALRKEHDRLLDQMSKELTVAVEDEQGALVQLNTILEKVGISELQSFSDQDSAVSAVMLRAKNATLKDESSRLDLHIQAVASALLNNVGPDLVSRIGNIESFRMRLSVARRQESSRYSRLYVEARSLLGEQVSDQIPCPLCGQDTNGPALLHRIDDYLGRNANWSKDVETLRLESEGVSETLRAQAAHVEELLALLQRFPQCAQIISDGQRLLHEIPGLRLILADAEHREQPINPQEFVEVETELQGIGRRALDAVTEHLSGLKLSKEDQLAVDLSTTIRTVGVCVTQLRETDRRLMSADARLHVANAVYESFKSAKQSTVQGVFDRLHDVLSAWYVRLHPDDEHGNVSIQVDATQRASAKLFIDSFGKSNQDPRAYASEGHLDSLGLIIFLAFAKEFQDDCNLLILDDVVSSVDAQHRQRICSLLADEFADWQLVITTHDPIWYEELWYQTIACRMADRVVRERITRWSRSGGPVLVPSLSRRERIDKYLVDGDWDAAGSQARSYLEGVLKEICEGTAARLRYKSRADYMVGELLEALQSRLGEMKDCSFKATLTKRLAELRSFSFMANILSHDNRALGAFSLSEVADFWMATKALCDAYVCPKCGKNKLMFDERLWGVTCVARGCDQGLVVKFKL